MRLRSLFAVLVAAAALLVPGPRSADAATVGSISIDEGSNFTESRTVTVRYKGFGLYERVFVQQCWVGPGPGFDYSVSCHPETMLFPGLIDREEGTVSFQLFVGDDPFGAFPVSCGPKTNPEYVQYDTCYLRAVTYEQSANDRAVFFPITFTGAKPATTTTTIPVTLAPTGPTTSAAATTTSTLPLASATTTKPSSGPSMAIDGGGGGRTNWWSPVLFVGGVAGLLVLAYGAVKRRRPARA